MKTSFCIALITLTLLLPPAFAQDPATESQTQGYGQGMMGGGMMGQSPNDDQATSIPINRKWANELLEYVRNNNLPCVQCHSISRGSVGPSFAMVSARYANQRDAATILKGHIENGFGRMPGGLANDPESKHLAEMILNLAKSNDQ